MSLNTLTEVEEPAEIGVLLGTGAHCHRSILREIRHEAVDASTNTVQPVLVLIANSNGHLPDSSKTTT